MESAKRLSEEMLKEIQKKIQNLPVDSLVLAKLNLLNDIKVLQYHKEYSLVCNLCRAFLGKDN